MIIISVVDMYLLLPCGCFEDQTLVRFDHHIFKGYDVAECVECGATWDGDETYLLPHKMRHDEIIAVYENALINMYKLAGVCWDGSRKCNDFQAVAAAALLKANPKLWKEIDELPYTQFNISLKTGEVSWRRKNTTSKQVGKK